MMDRLPRPFGSPMVYARRRIEASTDSPSLAGATVLGTLAVAAIVTLLNLADADYALGYRSAAAHAAIGTAAGLAAILGGNLILARIWHGGELAYLLTAAGLLVIGVMDIVLVVPTSEAATPFVVWFSLLSFLAGCLLLLGAAVVRSTRLDRPWLLGRRIGLGLVAGIGLIALVLWGVRSSLPIPADAGKSPSLAEAHGLSEPLSLLIVRLVSAAALAVAAYGFQARGRATRDELMIWLAGGTAIGGLAQLNYIIVPTNVSRWVFVGDLLRLGFFALVFCGAIREIASYETKLAEAAADAERGNLARDLHDGLAQELAFIASEARNASLRAGEAWIADIATAAERALAESRGTISLLAPRGDTLADTLHAAAEDVARRADARVHVDVDGTLDTTRATRAALVRVVREAAVNAVHHGGARNLSIRLAQEHGVLRLTVTDDGSGFDLGAGGQAAFGYGLSSMDARARELGGSLRIDSEPGSGTTVELTVP
jgi:signal transduction histidine kinase